MRVPSLNYSSLATSIQDKYSAQSGNFVNKGIQIATKGAEIAKSSARIASDSLKAKEDYTKKQNALDWARVGIKGLEATASIIESVYKIGQIKKAANQNESKTALLDFDAGFKSAIKSSVDAGNTTIDEFGHVQFGEDVQAYYDSYVSSVDANKWDSETKADHLASSKQIYASGETIAASFLNQKYQSEWYNGYQNNLVKAQGIDLNTYSFDQLQSGEITPAMRYAAGYAVIDSEVASGTLSVQSAQIEKAKYARAVDNATGQTVMSAVARQGGDRDAVAEWLRTNYGLTDQEINQINSIADTSAKNFMNNTIIPTAKAAMSESLNSYGSDNIVTPDQAKDAMRQTLTEQGQSEEHIQEALDAMDDEQYLWNQKRLLDTKGEIADMPQGDLILKRDELEQDHQAGWYSGSSETLYSSTYNSVVDAMNEEAKTVTAEEKELLTQLKTKIDNIYNDTTLTSDNKVQLIQSMLDDKSGDLNILNTEEDDLYMRQVLKKIIDDKVKTEYKPYADSVVDAICYNYAQTSGNGEVKNGKITYSDKKKGPSAADQKNAVDKVRGEAEVALAKVLEGASEMTYAEFTEACDRVKENFMAGMMKAVEGSTIFKDSSAQGTLDVLAENADAIELNAGQYSFNNSGLQNNYEEMVAHESEALSAMGIETKGLPVMYEKVVEKDGKKSTEVMPFPVYTTSDGHKLLRNNEGWFFITDENGSVLNINLNTVNDLPKTQTISKVKDVAKQLGVSEKEVIDSKTSIETAQRYDGRNGFNALDSINNSGAVGKYLIKEAAKEKGVSVNDFVKANGSAHKENLAAVNNVYNKLVKDEVVKYGTDFTGLDKTLASFNIDPNGEVGKKIKSALGKSTETKSQPSAEERRRMFETDEEE